MDLIKTLLTKVLIRGPWPCLCLITLNAIADIVENPRINAENEKKVQQLVDQDESLIMRYMSTREFLGIEWRGENRNMIEATIESTGIKAEHRRVLVINFPRNSKRLAPVVNDCLGKDTASTQAPSGAIVLWERDAQAVKRCLKKRLKALKWKTSEEDTIFDRRVDFRVFSSQPETAKKTMSFLKSLYLPFDSRPTPKIPINGKPRIYMMVGGYPNSERRSALAFLKDRLREELSPFDVQEIPFATTADLGRAVHDPETRGIIYLSHGGSDSASGKAYMSDADGRILREDLFQNPSLQKDDFFYVYSCHGDKVVNTYFPSCSNGPETMGTKGLQPMYFNRLNGGSLERFAEAVKRNMSQVSRSMDQRQPVKKASLSFSLQGFNDINNYFVFLNGMFVDVLPVNSTGNLESVKMQVPEEWLQPGQNKIRIAPRSMSLLTLQEGKLANEFSFGGILLTDSKGKRIFDDSRMYRIGMNPGHGNPEFPLGLASPDALPGQNQQPLPEKIIKFELSRSGQ